jgi:hypothetical protein
MSLRDVPPMARLLGLMGLLPFLIGGIGVWISALGDLRFALPIMLLAYGALIASFLGGVRWGAAMQNNNAESQARHIAISIMPSLVALVAFMLPMPQAFALLIVLFTAQAVLDVSAVESGDLAAWYKPLRLVLTLIACASMASLLVHALTH